MVCRRNNSKTEKSTGDSNSLYLQFKGWLESYSSKPKDIQNIFDECIGCYLIKDDEKDYSNKSVLSLHEYMEEKIVDGKMAITKNTLISKVLTTGNIEHGFGMQRKLVLVANSILLGIESQLWNRNITDSKVVRSNLGRKDYFKWFIFQMKGTKKRVEWKERLAEFVTQINNSVPPSKDSKKKVELEKIKGSTNTGIFDVTGDSHECIISVKPKNARQKTRRRMLCSKQWEFLRAG